MRNTVALILFVFLFLSCNMHQEANTTGMCEKDSMSADGIVRLSKIEVYPQYLDEYIKYAVEVGEVSLRTEAGVLTMYALQDKENPCLVTILETYSSKDAMRSILLLPIFKNTRKERFTWSSRFNYVIRLL